MLARFLLVTLVAAAVEWQVESSRVAVGMLASVQDPYKIRAEGVMSTWAKYFQGFAAYTFDEVDEGDADKFVHVPRQFDEEIYHNMNLVMISELVERFPDAEWYVQVDDDTLMLPHALLDVLEDMQPADEYILGGKCVGYQAHGKRHEMDVPFVVGGAGIAMSRKLALALAPHISECRAELNDWDYGDAKIGGCISWKLPDIHPVQCFAGMTNTLICAHDSVRNSEEWTKTHPGAESVVTMHLKKDFSFKEVWNAVEGAVGSRDPVKWDKIRENLEGISCAGEEEVDPNAGPVALLGEANAYRRSWARQDTNRQECVYTIRDSKTVSWEQACMKYFFTVA